MDIESNVKMDCRRLAEGMEPHNIWVLWKWVAYGFQRQQMLLAVVTSLLGLDQLMGWASLSSTSNGNQSFQSGRLLRCTLRKKETSGGNGKGKELAL